MHTYFKKAGHCFARFFSFLILCFGIQAGWAQTGPGVTDTEILIGQSCQLSGPLAALSSEVRQGASLYFDHINATGGIRGRKIKVIALDDAYDPKKAAENTRTLIEQEKVLALFQYAGTPPAMAAVPIAEEAGVPFITPFTGSDALRKKFSPYVFNIKAGYSAELETMVKQLATIGVTKVAVAYLNNPFGTDGLASVEKAAATSGVSLVAKAPVEVDRSKIDLAVDTIAKASPQAIIVVSAGKPSIDFVDAYLKAGHRSTFYMLSVISNAQLVAALGERARGIVVSQVVPSPWNQGIAVSREFQALARKAGIQDFTFSQMEGFVSAKFLVEGLKRAGNKPTRESLVRGLETMAKVDLGGFVVELSPTVHSSGRSVDMMILGRDGKFTR
jgi:branched-chain amino acid transport system substrate-binding protein